MLYRAAQESAEETADMMKHEVASLEGSVSSQDPGESEAQTSTTGLTIAAEASGTSESASPTTSNARSEYTRRPSRIAVGTYQEDTEAEEEADVATSQAPSRRPVSISIEVSPAPGGEPLPAAEQEAVPEAAAPSEGPLRFEDLQRQLTQLLSQNTELMTQLEEANSSLASSQELCTDLEVNLNPQNHMLESRK